jgi:hypothetical protein
MKNKMTKIATFGQFVNKMNESDGFGTSPFLMKKVSDLYHYFFNLDMEDDTVRGYHLIMGKYSDNETIEGPKNSYMVLTLNEISPEVIEDIAVDKEDIPQINKDKFKMGSNELSRLMEYVYKCVSNYMEVNPKVTRIYDEIQDNLQYDGKGSYMEYMKSISISQLGDSWSVQEGSDKNSIIISR